MPPICVICLKKDNNVILFVEKSLAKCKEILSIRCENNLNYNNAVLPSTPNKFEGYHVQCYRKFTALGKRFRKSVSGSQPSESYPNASVPMPSDVEASNSAAEIASMPSCSEMSNEETSDDSKICIFCDKARKKLHSRYLTLHLSSNNSIASSLISNAKKVNNYEFVNKIEDYVRAKRVIVYHLPCRNDFLRQCERSQPKEKTQYHLERECHSIAYKQVCDHINDIIFEQRKCILLKQLHTMYVDRLTEEFMARLHCSPNPFFANYLEQKLVQTYGKKINVLIEKNKTFIAPQNAESIPESEFQEILMFEAVQNVAFILRREILKIVPKKLPNDITVNSLKEGECNIPKILSFFYSSMLSGGDKRRQNSINNKRLVKSYAQDAIHGVTNGRLKTAKHITLAMALKSLTSSRNIVDIINRYGHCSSYTVTEELETEATFFASCRSQVSPDDIVRKPNIGTGLAFNNFDRFVDTIDGKDTLHDTVGIIFQDIVHESVDNEGNIREESSNIRTKKRRTFDAVTPDLEPLSKKRKGEQVIKPLSAEVVDRSSSKSQMRTNLLWMISHALGIPKTPMWVGFNSLIFLDESMQQKVSYMTTINLSPTNHAVVKETMNQAKQVAQECNESNMQVTYDLAIAKIALQIQAMESPAFDNLFIHVGGFHVMMAYFKAIGKFIDNCGLQNIMVDAQLLAAGSLNAFITGTHFNRCKRLHPILSLAMQILHFNNYVAVNNVAITEEIKLYIQNYAQSKHVSAEIDSPAVLDLIKNYEEYSQETINGEHGKTAQFYMMYIKLVEYYLLFTASIRTGNFALFKYIIPKITNLFFALNQPNYARWLVKYHYNLCNVEETHPGLKEVFEKGSFGIKRTEKSFSRQPVDLTLEQTINADAANKLRGILHFTNSLAARQRWCKSHSIRSSIISHVLQETGLKKNQDVTSDLEANKMKKNRKQLMDLIEKIVSNMNPFCGDVDKGELFNISSGQATSNEISNFLLNIENIGNSQREQFILECSENSDRFEKPIKRNKLLTFVNTIKKQKVVINNKIQEIRMQRDLFGRLLAIALDEKINIEKVLSFPLTPVPLSLCHLDGTICKTDKSALLKVLEIEIESTNPPYLDIIVIDGFFFLYLLKDIPLTFGNISKQILQSVLKQNAKNIAIIFDRYQSPSIKDTEHTLRGAVENRDYHITGGDQNRPRDFVRELRNLKFKEALVSFLISDWEKNEMAPFIGEKIVYVNFDKCYKFEVLNGIVKKTIDESFSCPAHDEADTKIVYHVCSIQTNNELNICIKCSDTDILIIMLANMNNVNNNCKIWIEAGIGNHKRYINVTQLYSHLGNSLCAALPGLHSLTGCDYNPSFYKKGKKRPFTILQGSLEFQQAFAELSNIEDNDFTQILNKIQEFVCRLYSLKKVNTVNEARLALFTKTYTYKDEEDLFQKNAKSVDASSLPPCEAELKKHLQRAAYISNIWRNAHKKILTNMLATENGWKDVDGRYDFDWFEGNQLPTFVKDVIIQPNENEDSQSECEQEDDIHETNSDTNDEESDSDADFV